MNTILPVLLSVFLLVAAPCISAAAPLKTYVSDFSVSGAPNKDELALSLQGILASRLSPEQVQLVESRDKAELLVSGSYAQFGKTFSLDVLLKRMPGGPINKVFEQGDSQDDLLPAMGRLTQKIERELAKSTVKATAPAPVAPAAVPLPVPVPPRAAATVTTPLIVPMEGYQVRSESAAENLPGSWSSAPLEGVFRGIAVGSILPSGEREIFVADESSIRRYLKGSDLKQTAAVEIPAPGKILAIDSADLDRDGTVELYVTVMDRETLSSRVYLSGTKGLELIAGNLPWFFRGIGQDLKIRTIYAQELVSGGKYYGEVSELVKSGKNFKSQNPLKLPRFGNIFNFNRLSGADGKDYFVVLDEDGYLVVSAPDGSEVWKSGDKYGGSEINFRIKSYEKYRSTRDEYRWSFLEQRLVITPQGELLVPHNEGTLNIGNNRSYSKHMIYAMVWNGSSLKEKWHTRPSQTYLADYAYDPDTKELILLEVVKKGGVIGKGKTVISINKID